ncbi:MAG: hypothetical protein H6729_07860 [Deltaproteobacteria bacterium]|nr:hypothetical protein [Deltaproteobacteria bacterium]
MNIFFRIEATAWPHRVAERLLNEQIDAPDSLSMTETSWLESHLEACAACRAQARALTTIDAHIKTWSTEEAPADFVERVLSRAQDRSRTPARLVGWRKPPHSVDHRRLSRAGSRPRFAGAFGLGFASAALLALFVGILIQRDKLTAASVDQTTLQIGGAGARETADKGASASTSGSADVAHAAPTRNTSDGQGSDGISAEPIQPSAPYPATDLTMSALGIGAAKARTQIVGAVQRAEGSMLESSNKQLVARIPRAHLMTLIDDLARRGSYAITKDSDRPLAEDEVLIRFTIEE